MNQGTITNLCESDIIHERGRFWILRRLSHDARIAPVGTVYFQLMEVAPSGTHSETRDYVTANRDRAIAACDRFAAMDAAKRGLKRTAGMEN